jgi:hypothetical protein
VSQVTTPPVQSAPVAAGKIRRSTQDNPLPTPQTGSVRFGSRTSPAPKSLSTWQTIHGIYKQLQLEDQATRRVFKGLAMKHGPDLVLPAFFSIPVIGWAAGVIALPFLGWMENRGGKIIDAERQHLANNKDKPLYHYLKLEDLWEGNATSRKKVPNPDKVINPKTKKDTASRMARTWNRLIDKLFTHEKAELTPALKQKLSIPLDEHKNPIGAAFSKFKRFINAREGLQQKWYYKLFLAPVDWFYQKFPLPKVIKAVALLPKLSILALFYMLKIKPRV